MEDKGFYTFSKGICPTVNVTALREFKFAPHDIAVQQANHYATGTPPTRKSDEEVAKIMIALYARKLL